jgi:hypothetical protein
MRSLYMRGVTAVLLFLVVSISITAQDTTETPPGTAAGTPTADIPIDRPWSVFVRSDAASGSTSLIFVETGTGEEVAVPVSGERYTIFGQSVLYYDPGVRRMKLATPNGRVIDHPFMQPAFDARRIDWAASRDGKMLAWTETHGDGGGGLSTVTTVSTADGDVQRMVLADGPRFDGLRALPVAFDTTRTVLFMDYQPDGLSGLTPFPQYVALFSLPLQDESPEPEFMPGEPAEFTGAGFGAGFYLRLKLSEDLRFFDLHIYNLDTGFDWVIPALRSRGFNQAGDVLIAPDGRQAVYALSQIANFGTPQQSVQTVFVLVDLVTMTQRALTDPITTFVRPVAWTEDNSAVIFTSPQRDGTWKIGASDGRLVRVAEATYLGALKPAGVSAAP